MRTAVIFGAGNVGRGFLGQLFSESGYHVTFVDVDEPLIHALNENHAYSIRLVENERVDEAHIAPVDALHSRQKDEVARALAGADLAATSVGARVLPAVAPLVAAGLRQRFQAGSPAPLNIIICENLKDAAQVFREMVAGHMLAQDAEWFDARVGFVDTVIGRMVPPPTAEMRAEDPRLIAVEPYKELPVDRRGFVGTIPQISGMEVCDNFGAYTARKLYIHNCGHAVLAYLGFQRGHTFGYEALEDPRIRPWFERALAESRAGIVAEYGVEAAWLEKHTIDLVRRFANRALGDTIFRLGRDPLRKLAASDRLVGAARLAEKAGIVPEALSLGIAAAYAFQDPADPLALELQQRIAARGLGAAMLEVSGIQPYEPLGMRVADAYARLNRGEWA
jgi:mannitol-1-phosphate 5-dehydrogenase